MTVAEPAAPRGVGARILGVVMIIVGSLDMMLFWRDGQTPSWFFVLLFAAGILLYSVGSIRGGAAGSKKDYLDR